MHGLFDVCGVEIEYMVVDRTTLEVTPVVDRLLTAQAGQLVSDVTVDAFGWSNELVAHVVEVKVNEPAPSLRGLAAGFQRQVELINSHLAPMGARLMPGGAHPWMDPTRDTVLWAHEYSEIYRVYDRIFDCRRHGWANLQSMHLNLPFADDAEFARLHAAVRLALPLLPALAAATPVLDGAYTGLLDSRMEVYRHNSKLIPSITGAVIPEPVYTQADYEREILQRIYADIAARDPDGELQDEFLNSRGAIARFGRNALEIRVLDAQESPRADLAVAWATFHLVRALVEQRWSRTAEQQGFPTEALAEILGSTIAQADEAPIANAAYLRLLGWPGRTPATAGALWDHLLAEEVPAEQEHREALQLIRRKGPLARRIVRALGPQPDRARLAEVYGRLCDVLAQGGLFDP